jgi:hypothetical protein
MAGRLTQYGANRAVQAGLGDAVAASAAMYLALATAVPAGSVTANLAAYGSVELTTAGYARQPVTWDPATGSDPSVMASAALVTFGPFEADPPEIGYLFLCTTSIGTVGYVMACWQFETARDPAEDDSLNIGAGDLTMGVA